MESKIYQVVKPVFLLNKVARHIREWNINKQPLHLGNLDSYRNILHASDIANAIYNIVTQEKGDNYLICNNKNYKVVDLVMKMYEKSNIHLIYKENIYYEISSNLPVIIINEGQKSFDSTPTNINGEAIKLKNIGWEPLISIESILDEIYFTK